MIAKYLPIVQEILKQVQDSGKPKLLADYQL